MKTENSVGNILTKNKKRIAKQFDKCGVFHLTCHDSNGKYIAPTDRHFHVRFQEYFRDFKHGNGNLCTHSTSQKIDTTVNLWKISWNNYK